MKIIVTGAAGYLGSHLTAALQRAGHEVVGVDRVASTSGTAAFVAADLSDAAAEAAVSALLAGADCVAHCAGLHPWKQYTDEQYLDANIKGTWNLYRWAERAGVQRVVLSSSIAASGYSIPASDWPVREETRYALPDLYCFTKRAQEEIAMMFADSGKVRTIALRPPAFMPKLPLEAGKHLLGNYAFVEDIVDAHLCTIEVALGTRKAELATEAFEAVFVTNALPYTADDGALYQEQGITALAEKHWPEATQWLRESGLAGVGVAASYDLSKARRMLDWQPKRNFGPWFNEARHHKPAISGAAVGATGTPLP